MPEFTNNKNSHQYELVTDGHVSTAKYRLDGKTLYIDRVYVPDELRGRGIAAQVMEHVLQDASEHGLHIVPVCSYAVSYMARHKL